MVHFKLEIDGELKEFNFPNGWDEVTIELFEKVAKIDHTIENEITHALTVISTVTGMDLDNVRLIPTNEFPKIMKNLDFIKSDPPKKQRKSIVVDGEKYFIRQKDDFKNLSVGEVESIEQIKRKYGENIPAAFAEYLCVFLRKKLENGNFESFRNSHMERAELFRKNVKISDVYGLFIFFSSGKSTSIKGMKGSSQKAVKKKTSSKK